MENSERRATKPIVSDTRGKLLTQPRIVSSSMLGQMSFSSERPNKIRMLWSLRLSIEHTHMQTLARMGYSRLVWSISL
jgi:hypothetical protein